MEGAAMIYPCMKSHRRSLQSTTTGAIGFSLSRLFTQMGEFDPVVILKARLFTTNCVRSVCIIGNQSDLFLDLKEIIPHSNPQTDVNDD